MSGPEGLSVKVGPSVPIVTVHRNDQSAYNSADIVFLTGPAIEIAGQEKLKLVNVSLGTTFDRGVIDYRNLEVKEQIEASYQFLKFEFL